MNFGLDWFIGFDLFFTGAGLKWLKHKGMIEYKYVRVYGEQMYLHCDMDPLRTFGQTWILSKSLAEDLAVWKVYTVKTQNHVRFLIRAHWKTLVTVKVHAMRPNTDVRRETRRKKILLRLPSNDPSRSFFQRKRRHQNSRLVFFGRLQSHGQTIRAAVPDAHSRL